MTAEIGIGMLGHAFMGRRIPCAFRELSRLETPPQPRLVSIAGRDETAVAEAASRYG